MARLIKGVHNLLRTSEPEFHAFTLDKNEISVGLYIPGNPLVQGAIISKSDAISLVDQLVRAIAITGDIK